MSKHYHIAATTNTSLVIAFPTLLEQFRGRGLNQTSPTRPGNLKNQQVLAENHYVQTPFGFRQMSARFPVSNNNPQAPQSEQFRDQGPGRPKHFFE